jgi:uncharacterized protein (TIGR02118 family)
MSKIIFVIQRKAGTSREECHREWGSPRHVGIVGKLPGLTRWLRNEVTGAPGEPVCDGIGELWFESETAMEAALKSPEMGAAVEDAKAFLDMDRTGLLIVREAEG